MLALGPTRYGTPARVALCAQLTFELVFFDTQSASHVIAKAIPPPSDLLASIIEEIMLKERHVRLLQKSPKPPIDKCAVI